MSFKLPDRCYFQTVSPELGKFELNPLVVVHLLDEDNSFKVLRNALTFHSGHFAELLEEDPQQSVITASGIGSSLFKLVECWLRTGCFPPLGVRLSYADAVTVYNFADTYAMPRLRNAVIDLVLATIFDNQRFPLAALNDIYSRTAPGYSFRRLLVDIAITVFNWEDMVLKSDLIPKDFLLEVFDAIRGKTVRLGGPILFPVEVWYNKMLAPLCNWHEHVEPALYARMNSGDEELEAGDCNSAEGKSGVSGL